MTQIEVQINGDILTVTALGPLTSDELVDIARKHYSNDAVRHVIWDFSAASLSGISNADVLHIAEETHKVLQGGFRKNGRTVFVGVEKFEIGILNMYVAFAEMEGIQIDYKLTKSLKEAHAWLNS